MSGRLKLHLVCGDYEITRPLKEGAVQPEGIDLHVSTHLDSTARHARFLHTGDFDAAELSASSYIMGHDRDLPFRAIPVFPHRRFRHGFAFVNTAAGIRTPQDLVGRRVGVTAYQATALVWLRGILEQEHGVPHRAIDWFSELDEDVPFDPPPGLRLTRLTPGAPIGTRLAEGALDAVLHTDVIAPFVAADPRVARLFPGHQAAEEAYVRRTGIFPIMHVLALRAALVERHDWVAASLYRAFDEARHLAMRRMANPRLVPLAWYQEAWEHERAVLGPDPWAYGLGPLNRRNIETLAGYLATQGLVSRPLTPEALFLPIPS